MSADRMADGSRNRKETQHERLRRFQEGGGEGACFPIGRQWGRTLMAREEIKVLGTSYSEFIAAILDGRVRVPPRCRKIRYVPVSWAARTNGNGGKVIVPTRYDIKLFGCKLPNGEWGDISILSYAREHGYLLPGFTLNAVREEWQKWRKSSLAGERAEKCFSLRRQMSTRELECLGKSADGKWIKYECNVADAQDVIPKDAKCVGLHLGHNAVIPVSSPIDVLLLVCKKMLSYRKASERLRDAIFRAGIHWLGNNPNRQDRPHAVSADGYSVDLACDGNEAISRAAKVLEWSEWPADRAKIVYKVPKEEPRDVGEENILVCNIADAEEEIPLDARYVSLTLARNLVIDVSTPRDVLLWVCKKMQIFCPQALEKVLQEGKLTWLKRDPIGMRKPCEISRTCFVDLVGTGIIPIKRAAKILKWSRWPSDDAKITCYVSTQPNESKAETESGGVSSGAGGETTLEDLSISALLDD